jgi:hypothetical protein
MPVISLGAAAKRAGVSRPTMWRLVNSGKVSASRNARGAWVIEESEFARAVAAGFVQVNSSADGSLNSDEKLFEQSVLLAEVQVLRQAVAELREDKLTLNERVTQLLKIIETQAEQNRLLTDQRSPRRRKWWNPWG